MILIGFLLLLVNLSFFICLTDLLCWRSSHCMQTSSSLPGQCGRLLQIPSKPQPILPPLPRELTILTASECLFASTDKHNCLNEGHNASCAWSTRDTRQLFPCKIYK